MGETKRRRDVQLAYNKKHGITPMTISKAINDITEGMESDHAKAVNAELALDMELFAAVEAASKGKKGRGKKNPIEKLIAIKEAEKTADAKAAKLVSGKSFAECIENAPDSDSEDYSSE